MASWITYKGLNVPDSPTGDAGMYLKSDLQALADRAGPANFTATTNPTSSNDVTQGYQAGSFWLNTSTGSCFVCTNNATGAAAWLLLGPLPVFGPSGSGHSKGVVPDPGSTAGSTRFLREDATFDVPPTFGASGSGHAPGYVPDPGPDAGAVNFLREDATWAQPPYAVDVETDGGGGAFFSYGADVFVDVLESAAGGALNFGGIGPYSGQFTALVVENETNSVIQLSGQSNCVVGGNGGTEYAIWSPLVYSAVQQGNCVAAIAAPGSSVNMPTLTGVYPVVPIDSYSGGTYTLTASVAAVSSIGAITLPAVTTQPSYRLKAWVQIDAEDATLTNQTVTVKIRRTNNTAADALGPITLALPATTTRTQSLFCVTLPENTYQQTPAGGDVLALEAGLSALPGNSPTGTVQITGAWISAQPVSPN
jgi:hypothetical protein